MISRNDLPWDGEAGHFVIENEPVLGGANFTAKVGVD